MHTVEERAPVLRRTWLCQEASGILIALHPECKGYRFLEVMLCIPNRGVRSPALRQLKSTTRRVRLQKPWMPPWISTPPLTDVPVTDTTEAMEPLLLHGGLEVRLFLFSDSTLPFQQRLPPPTIWHSLRMIHM